jgi:hypothetical protein
MPGGNYGLAKGFLMTGSSAVANGTVAKLSAASALQPAQVALATAASDIIIGVFQEDVDAAKVTTGKATVSVLIEGIAKCVAGAAVTLGDYVTATTGGQLITTVTAADRIVGIALSAAAAQGDIFDVYLTIGSKRGA